MKGWESKSLGAVCRVIAGQSPEGVHYNCEGDGLPFYQGKKDFGAKFIDAPRVWTREVTKEAVDGDILMSVRAPVGPINFATQRVCIGRGLAAIRAGTHIDKDFLFYSLLSKESEISGNEGAVFASINKKQIEDLELMVPPLPEQRRIVALLDEAFEGLAIATANAEKNLKNAREVFESYLESVVDESWKDGALTELSELATDISDGDHMPPPKANEGIPFITIGNINKSTRTIDFSDTFKVPLEYFDALKSNKKPRIGDVLYTVTGSFGIPVLVDETTESRFCFQRHIGLVRPNADLNSKWLYYLLMSPQVFRQANEKATGTAQKTVSLKVLRGFTVPKVPFEKQVEIASKLDELAGKAEILQGVLRRKLAAIAELKQSLLQKAFAGELTKDFCSRVAVSQPAAPIVVLQPDLHAGLLAIAFDRHRRRKRENTFGRVKAQKFLHLTESIGRIDLGRKPIKDAAGPNDFQHMLKAEDWAKQNQAFEFVQRGKGYEFTPLAQFDKHLKSAEEALKPYQSAVKSVVDLILDMNSEEAELFATVHAAWNNLIIDGKPISDETIVREARENWHPDKLKIPEQRFRDALNSIRTRKLEPDGSAKYVGGQTQLL